MYLKDFFQERKPLLVFPLGAVSSGRRNEDGSVMFQCKTHAAIDCNDCFDWPKVIVRQAQQKVHKSEGRIQNRTDLLGLLQAIGIDMPSSTKLPEDILEKKFAHALTKSQGLFASETQIINPATLPVWKVGQLHFDERKMTRFVPGKYGNSRFARYSSNQCHGGL